MKLGKRGERMENNLNLNLKGGKIVKSGNQGVGRQQSFNLNLEGWKWIKLGNQGVGRPKKKLDFFLLNLVRGGQNVWKWI